MGSAERKLVVKVLGDASSYKRSLGDVDKASSRLTRTSGGVARGIGRVAKAGAIAAGAAGVGGLFVTLRAGIADWKENTKVAAQTEARIKSTGGIANVTAGAVKRLGAEVQAYSGISDEAVREGANLLLTFKQVRNEAGKGNKVFDRATKAAVDLSVAGFGSIDSSSKMLGKALNDPVRGITALRRAGVTFTDGQQKTIKSLVESGRMLEAQKLILREVESQVGGSAKAYGDTLPGQISKLRETFGDLAGELVGKVVPGLNGAVGAAAGFLSKISQAKGFKARLNVVWDGVQSAARDLFNVVVRAVRGIDWKEVGETVQLGIARAFELAGRINYPQIFGRVAQAAFNGLTRAIDSVDWARVGRAIGDRIVLSLNRIADFVNQTDWGKVGKALVDGAGKALAALFAFLRGVKWRSVIGAMLRALAAVIRGSIKLLGTIALELGKAIVKAIVRGLAGLAKSAGSAIREKLSQAISNAGNVVVRKALELVKKILGAFSFLGRFDPFKGLREKAATRLKQMEADARSSTGAIQASIDGLRDKTVTITIRTVTAVGDAADRTGGGRIAPRSPSSAGGSKGASRRAKAEAAAAQKAAAEAAAAQKAAARAAARARADSAAKAEAAAKAARAAAEKTRSAYDALMESLELKLDRARLTRRFSDDLRRLGEMEDAIKRQIAAEGRTTELARRLFEVRQERADVLRRRAQARQFRALGLTDTGDTPVPGVKSLRRQLLSVGKAIRGTFLDTGKTRSLLQSIRKLLAGKLGELGRDVRAKVKEILDDLNAQLGQSTAKASRNQTRFKKVSTKAFTAGLELSAAQRKELAFRLAQIGPGGSVPNRGTGAFGVAFPRDGRPRSSSTGGGAATTYVFNGPITINGSDGAFEREVQKKARRNRAPRRGANVGRNRGL